jgi:prophage regulatory protein
MNQTFLKHRVKMRPNEISTGIANMTDFYRIKDLTQLFKVNASTIWRWLAAGKMPAPLKIAANTTAWRVDEINEWIASRPRVTTKKAATDLTVTA